MAYNTGELDRNNQPIKEKPASLADLYTGRVRSAVPTEAIVGGMERFENPNERPFFPGQNREAVESQYQSGWAMTRNALVQAGAEVTLGTLEGISYLADVEQMKNVLQGTEKEYSNWFADLMKQGKETVNQDIAPIYRSEAAQSGFAPTDFSWWADNGKNLASTLSLMVPAYGATQVISALGKAAKASKILNTVSKINRAKGVSQAVLSRYMENTMEASETFNASYQDLISQGVSDEEARTRAGSAASKAWNTNWVNLAFDVVQYDALTKGMNSANRMSKEFRKGIGSKALDFVGTMAQEGIEEGSQFIISQEAQRSVAKDKSFFEAKGLGTRLGDYIEDPEFKASVMLGAVGGGVFAGVGAAGNAYSNRASKVQDLSLATQFALDADDITTAHKTQGAALLKQAYAYAKAGKINDLIEHYKQFSEATDEELTAKGMTPEQISDKRNKDKNIAEDLQFISEQYSTINEDPNKNDIVKTKELATFYEQRVIKRAETELNAVLDKHVIEANKSAASPLHTELTVQNATKLAYTALKKKYEEEHKDKQGASDVIASLDKKIAAVDEKIKATNESLKAEGKSTEAPANSQDKNIFKAVVDKVNNDIHQEELNRVSTNLKTEEGQKELEKEVIKDAQDNVINGITSETSLDDIDQLLNSKVKDRAKKVIDKIADEGEKQMKPSNAEQVKERYKNTPLLHRELNAFKDMGAKVDGIKTAEDIAAKYSKDAKFKEIVDKYFNDKLNNAFKHSDNIPSDNMDDNAFSEDISDSVFPVREFSNDHSSNKSIIASNPYVMYYNEGGQLRFTQANPIDFAGKTVKDFTHIHQGGPHILYDSEGQPVRSKWNTIVNKETEETVPLITDETFKILDDPEIDIIGNNLTFSIYLDSTQSPSVEKITADNFAIIINTEINGKSHRIGTLRVVDALEADTDSIKARKLRESIYNEWKASGQTNGVFTSSINDVLISDRTQGHFNLFPPKTYQAPHMIINEGEDLFFGVIDTDANGEVLVHTKQGEVRFGISNFQKRIRSNSNLADRRGTVVQFLKTPNGSYAISKLFTSKLSTFPTEQKFVKDTLEKFNEEVQKLNTQEEINALVAKTSKKMLGTIFIRFQYKDGNYMNVTRDHNKDVVLSDPFTLEEYIEFLNNKVVDVDLDQLNVEDYNKRISEKGFVKTNIQPGNHFLASMVKMRLPESFNVSEPIVTETTTGETKIHEITDKKGRKFTYYKNVKKEGNLTITDFTFNRNDKSIDQRNKVVNGIPVETALENKYDIAYEYLQEGTKVISIIELRTDGKKASATAIIELDGIQTKTDIILTPKKAVTVEPVTSDIDVEAKINEIKENNSFIKLSEDGKTYVNTKTGKIYQRVTNFISDDEVVTNPLLESSQIIGTKIDILTRDFFDNKITEESSKEVLGFYNVSSIKEVKKFLKGLQIIKDQMISRNETVLSNDIVLYNDEIGVAGTVDLLTYDNKGNFRIYDMKTMRGNNFTSSYANDESNKYETTKYGKSKKQKHQEQLSVYRILLNNTHGVKAITLGVIPIEISYNAGDTSTTVLNLLKGVQLKPLDKVKTAELAALEETKETPKAINIYAGTNENAELSNFAIRPFDIDGDVFQTVEGAFQARKMDFSNAYWTPETMGESGQLLQDLADADGKTAKALGRKIKGLDTQKWDKESSAIMKNLITASFKQNPKALQELLATGNATLTHTQDKGKWGKEFPKLLMEVREELKETPKPKVERRKGKRSSIPRKSDRNRVKTETSYEVWNEKEETAWFAKYYPNLDKATIADLKKIGIAGGVDLWGMFKNGAIYIDSQAKTGTLYHEAFHLVFHIMLTPNERKHILSLASTQTKGIINKEEELADVFMEHKLTEGNASKGLVGEVLDFFKRLYNLIQIAAERVGLKNAPSLNVYMYRIDRGLYGKFKAPKFTKNVSRFKVSDSEKKGYLNDREQQIAQRHINNMLFFDILPDLRKELKIEGKDDQETIQYVLKKGRNDKYTDYNIAGMYTRVYDNLLVDLEDAKADGDEQAIDELQRLVYTMGEIDNTTSQLSLNPFIEKALTRLAEKGVKISVINNTAKTASNTQENDNVMEMSESEDSLEGWQVKVEYMSPFESFSQRFLKTLSIVPTKEGSFGGFQIYEDPSKVKLSLLNGIANSINEIDMMVNLDNMIEKFPQYEVLRKEFQNNPTLLSEAWNNIGQRTHVPHVGLRNDRGGNAFSFESTRKTLNKDLMNNWQALFYDTNMYIKSSGEVKVPSADKLIERINGLKDKILGADALDQRIAASSKLIGELHGITNTIGLPITLEELTKMFGQNKKGFKDLHAFVLGAGESNAGLRTIVLSMTKGNDPYDGTSITNKEALVNMADKVVEVSPHMYQVSFIDGDGKNRFALLQARFMLKFVNRIKHPQYRTQMLESYRRDPFFKNSPFLNDIEGNATFNSKLRIGMFDVVSQDGRKSKLQYSQMNKAELEATKISMWFDKHADGKADPFYGWYFFPVLSDITTAPMMQSLKFDTDVAIKKLIESANQEKDLVDWVNAQILPVKEEFDKWLKNDGELPTSLKKIPTQLLLNGRTYQHFAFLNAEVNLNDANFDKLAEKGIRRMLKEEVDALFTENVVKRNAQNNTVQDLTGIIHKDFIAKFDENIEKYVANSMYMNIQLISTFAGPLAYYKGKGDVNMEDVFKRLKEIYSPSETISINPENTFGDFKVREQYNTSYVADPSDKEKIRTEHVEAFTTIFPGEANKGLRIGYGVEDNPNKPNDGGLNITDAATFIDIYRHKEIAAGTTLWTDEHENVYNDIMAGKNLPANAAIVLNPFKPFQFGHTSISQGNDVALMSPYQHKNAEFILVPQMAKGNPTLQKILTKMGYTFKPDGSFTFDTKNRITDSVMFGTAVKVGQYNVVNTIDEISVENVHTFNNSDYGIQGKTPEHHIDAENLFATQVRKLMTGGLDMKATYDFKMPDGKDATGQQIFDLYQELIHQNLLASYENIKKEWYDENGNADKVKFVEFLRKQVSEDQHGPEILEALDWLDEDKQETVLPLWHPSIVGMVENIFNSFYKNNITKQKINGASLYNAPSYGFENDNSKGLRKPKIVFSEENRSIEYFEALMPVTSKRLISKYMDANGMIDVKRLEKIDPKLVRAIFYRIPTEGMYSIIHIKVIGYIPTGAIVLPDEITSIAGLDFDIDKMFGMLYNLEEAQGDVVEEAYAAWEAYDSTERINPKTNALYTKNKIPNYDPERGRIDYANNNDLEWDSEDQVFRKTTEIKAIPSGFDTKESRDNMLIDLMYAVLKNSNSATQQLSPGSFKTIKDAKDTVLDLQGNASKKDLSPLRLSTMREIFERNMTGLTLIGITANHTSNHALMIHGNFNFREDISINGYSSRSLSMTTNRDGVLISKLLAEFSAAAVDNAKEPLSSFLNMTPTTIDVIEAMVRVGHDMHTVFAFINNPIIRKFTEYEKADSGRNSKDAAIDALKKELIKTMKDKEVLDGYDEFHKKGSENTLTLSTLTDKDGKVKYTGTLADSIKTEGKELKELTAEELYVQREVLDLFSKTLSKGEALGKTMSKMRYDSIKNAAGPTIAHTHQKVLAYNKIDENILTGFEEFRDSKVIPYVNDFYALGIEPVRKAFHKFTDAPYAKDNNIFSDIVSLFDAYSTEVLSAEEINELYRMTMTVFATDFPTYAPKEIERVVRNLPKRIQEYNSKNENGAFSLFLKNFTTRSVEYKNGKIVSPNKYPILNFNRLGVDKMHQEDMRSMWKGMLNAETEEEIAIAKDLDVYAFASTGFTFGYNTFKDLTPVKYMSELQENGIKFTDHLKKNFNDDLSADTKMGIVDQIVKNNYRTMYSIEMIDTSVNKEFKLLGKEGSRQLTMPKDMRKVMTTHPIRTEEKNVYADYVKMNAGKDGKTEMILLKLVPMDGDLVTYVEVQRLGIQDKGLKMIEMSYDHIVNNRPYYSFYNDLIRESLIDIQKVQAVATLENTLMSDKLNAAYNASQKPVTQSEKLTTDSQKIYSELPNKTESENVVINYSGVEATIKYAKSIGGVYSMRVPNSEKHFGNPFSSVGSVLAKNPTLIKTKSTKESVEKYINWVITSQEDRAEWIREQLKSGIIKGKPIVYYKELGEPSHANALDYLINKYNWDKSTQSETVVTDTIETPSVEYFKGFWTRAQVASQTDKVFLFGDNTEDRLNTKYIPSSTQAVIRGLPNALGIDTKKDRGVNTNSYFTDAKFDQFKKHVDSVIQQAKDSGKTIVIPADGIGTGKAKLAEKAPKLFEYLQQELNKLKENKIESTSNETPIIEIGRYVQFNNEIFIVTQINSNGTVQIYNPNLEGAAAKKSVAERNLAPLKHKATAVSYKGNEYMVTPKNVIISLTTNKIMKWGDENGDRQAILRLSDNNVSAPTTVVATPTSTVTEVQSTLSLTQEQQEAIDSIENFLINGNPNEWYMLEGKAGTGKTTSIRKVIENHTREPIAIAALSHKAKNVIGESVTVDGKIPRNVNLYSLAGLLGMTMDMETGEFSQGFNDGFAEIPVESAKIIIVDEASMINEEALDLIMKNKREDAKVIFLGDIGQLPPIRKDKAKVDNDSPVFTTDNRSRLLTRIRQGEQSPILPYADNYWDNSQAESKVLDPIPSEERVSKLTKEGNLIFGDKKATLDIAIEEYQKSVETKNPNLIKIVCYRNATRNNINKHVHDKIFGDIEYGEGEIVMFFDSFTPAGNVLKGFKFENSDEVQIQSIKEDIFYPNGKPFQGYHVTTIVKDEKGRDTPIDFRVIKGTDKLNYNLMVSTLFTEAAKYPKGAIRTTAYKQAWAAKNYFANIDYAYAITSHKSQGSTYNSVVIIEDDIMNVGPISNKAKSNAMYTAITRAKKNVIIVSDKNKETVSDFNLLENIGYQDLKGTGLTNEDINDIKDCPTS